MQWRRVWTPASIVLAGIVMMVFLPLVVSVFSVVFDTIDDAINQMTPAENPSPFLRTLIGVTKEIYDSLKTLVTNRYAAALLIAVGLAIMGLEVEWERRGA